MIESVHMRGFGKFEDKSFDFPNGVFVFAGDNEFGKTTIFRFISVMLYGMPNSTRRTDELSLRDLCRPRYAQNYGGEMVVRAKNGKRIFIQRTFGKTARFDTCEVFYADTWEKLLLSSSVGEFVYGFGRDAFEKTLYIANNGLPQTQGNTAELVTKLCNMKTSGEEEVSYTRMLEKTDKAIAAIQTKNERGGTLVRVRQKMSALSREMQDIEYDLQKNSHTSALQKQLLHKQEQLRAEKKELNILENNAISAEKDETNSLADAKYLEAQNSLLRLQNQQQDMHIKKNKWQNRNRFLSVITVMLLVCACFLFVRQKSVMCWAGLFLGALCACCMQIYGFIKYKICVAQCVEKNKQIEEIQAKLLFWEKKEKNVSSVDTLLLQELQKKREIIEKQENEIASSLRETDRTMHTMEHLSSLLHTKRDEYAALQETQTKLVQQLEAYQYVRKWLTEAYAQIRQNFTPRLNERISDILSFLTDGAWKSVKVDEMLNLHIQTSKGDICLPQQLSDGTADVLYISFRLAIAEMLSSGQVMFFTADDAFLRLDAKRLQRLISYIKKNNYQQFIIFTAQKQIFSDCDVKIQED